MAKTILIHGFGELPSIFANIEKKIKGEKIFINVWEELKNQNIQEVNVVHFSAYLAQKYKIDKSDLILGHSMGGWIAIHIKQITLCSVIQLASWTNPKKILVPTLNPKIIYFLFNNNLYINTIMRFLLSLLYPNHKARFFFMDTFNRLMHAPKTEVLKQLRLMFEPAPSLTLSPDLRLHAKADTIFKYPSEDFIEIKGDHFMLSVYAEETFEKMIYFLEKWNKTKP